MAEEACKWIVKTQTKTKDHIYNICEECMHTHTPYIYIYTFGTLSEGALCGELKCLFPSGEKVKGTFLMGSSAHTSSSSVAPKHDRAYSPEALMK